MDGVRRSSRVNKGINSRLDETRRLEEELAHSGRKRKADELVENSDNKLTKNSDNKFVENSDNKLTKTSDTKLTKNSDNKLTKTSNDNTQNPNDNTQNSNDNKNKNGTVYEEVRCLVCGVTDETYSEQSDIGGIMLECEKCLTWQHSKCMFGHASKKKLPKVYECEICRPEQYPTILHKLDPMLYFKSLLNKQIYSRADLMGFLVAQESKLVGKTASSITKKSNSEVNKTFSKKASKPLDKPIKKTNNSLVKDKIRESVKNQFGKLFSQNLSLSDSDACNWAINLEQHLYNAFYINSYDPYREKYRNLYAALKDPKNNKLRNRLITGELGLAEFVSLKNEQLINPDMQQFRKDSIKQSIVESTLKVPTQIPKIKKTHKGDEVIEDDNENYAENATFFNGAAKDSESKIQPAKPANHLEDTPTSTTEKTSINDNLGFSYNDEVNEKIVDVSDDDLDHIIGDERPGSEEDFDTNKAEKRMVWKGNVLFAEIPNFNALLLFCGNSYGSVSSSIDISHTLLNINQPLVLEGRLDKAKAESYLDQILSTRNLIVTELEPQPSQYADFLEIYKYFRSKLRYGVVKNHKPHIKDIYLVPLNEQSKETLPGFLQSIRNLNYEFTGEPRLYLVFTVKKDFLPSQALVKSIQSQLHTENSPLSMLQNTTLQSLASSLAPQQVQLLEQIILQNPEAHNDPQKLVSLLSSYLHQ